MNIPLPQVIPNTPAGGNILGAMNALNDYRNNIALRRYNEEKAKYARETLLAQAASQAAYANNVGPQFIAKILQDAGFKGSTSDPKLAQLAQIVQNAGLRQNPLLNHLNQVMAESYGNMDNKPKNAISWMMDKFKSMIHPDQQQAQNALLNPMQSPVMPQQNGNMARTFMPAQQSAAQSSPPQYVDENGNPVDKDETITPVTEEEAQALEDLNNGRNPIEMELNTGKRKRAPSYGLNEQKYLSIQEQGKGLGKAKSDMQKTMGESQLSLSNSGASIDRLIDEFTGPEFVALRNDFPYLQDMQLEAASHLNDPRVQDMIGRIKADIESFKGSTVMGFGGQTLKREFDYADQLKPSTKDTVYTATGKLQTLKALHDIAEKKNYLINQYLKDPNMTPAESVEKANKKVDISAIDKKVKQLTAPAIKIKNPKTHAEMWITLPRAKELHFTKEQLKKFGLKHE